LSGALPTSYLAHRGFLFLWLALALMGVATLAYAWHDPIGGRSGDTWVGYTLGVLSAALVVWLLWLGVRKRSYYSTGAKLSTWLSAHVYFGATLLVLVPLHAAFEFGWNVHTLAFLLLAAVVLTGFVAVLLYGSLPEAITRDRGGRSLATVFGEIADLDAQLHELARTQPDDVSRAVKSAIDETRIGGGPLRQLSGRAPDCATSRAERLIGQMAGAPGDREIRNRVLELLVRKRTLLTLVRRDVRRRSLLNLFLVLHVPLSTATVAAVAVHVVVVFYYW
jgi:hypothetical protein